MSKGVKTNYFDEKNKDNINKDNINKDNINKDNINKDISNKIKKKLILNFF